MKTLFRRLIDATVRLLRRREPKATTSALPATIEQAAQPEAAGVTTREIVAVPAAVPAPAPAPAAAPAQLPALLPSLFPALVRARKQAPPEISAAPPPPAAPPAPAPSPARFITAKYADASAERDYKLYIPPGAGARPLPLVVMLHGCKQNATDFAAGTAMNTLAKAQGFFVLYPEQSQQANPQRCWNWFKHTHQARGRGEPALLAGMTRHVMTRHAIDASRVYVAGLSAGGAMAAILGDAYPDLYAAVGVHSGLATGIAKDLSSAFGAMRRATHLAPAEPSGVPTIVFHGDSDDTVHPGNAGHVIAASVHKGAAVEEQEGTAPGGRHYTRELYRAPGLNRVIAEHWIVHGSPHAWSGGNPRGSFTDPHGPDASAEMVRFFFEHPHSAFGKMTSSSP